MQHSESRVVRRLLASLLLAALAACEGDPAPADTRAPGRAGTSPDEDRARDAIDETPLGHVVSTHASGHGRFVMGSSEGPAELGAVPVETAARLHLARHAGVLGLYGAALAEAEVLSRHALVGGATIVQFAQRVGGIPVFHARASVVLDAKKRLVSIANDLAAGAPQSGKVAQFGLSREAAVVAAYRERAGSTRPERAVTDLGARDDDWHEYALATEPAAPRVLEASVKRVLFPEARALVPAYHVELITRTPGAHKDEGFGYVIDARDRRVLHRASLTADDVFKYRVWADPTGLQTPADGPLVDSTPHPSGRPDKVQPAFAEPVLVEAGGDGDPWLRASDTVTFGNNVRAYSDRTQFSDDAGVARNDGFQPGVDVRADLTSPQTFDRSYDLTQPPEASADQIKAAVTQIFYTTNWLHDYWYDSGFTEAAGNAQLANYGRGGVEGDPLLAEAQDSADTGQANNANMTTRADGRSPRMQMYVWNGLPNRTLATSPALTVADGLGAASFGPQTFSLTGGTELVLANDGSTALPAGTTGTGTVSDACQLPSNVSGRIAVIDRGVCVFTQKTQNAQAAGAVAVLILNNAAGNAPPSPSGEDTSITIPVLGLSFEDGQKLKALLASGAPVRATTFARGTEIERDGTIDNTIVAHEWGHYLHHRLVTCGSSSCGGMSEGWGDFTALMMVVREGDTFEGKAYPLSQYALAGLNQNAAYFGIRRAPYSIDFDKNPFTFQHVRRSSKLPTRAPLAPASVDMAEVHNVGEIWAQTLFDGYVNVLREGERAGRSFDVSKRRMTDYMVAGMQAAPIEPTFVEQRDAILASVLAMAKSDATRWGDFHALARGFATRGLGVGAVAPPTSSDSLDEAEESFAYKGNLVLRSATLDDSVRSCDGDGKLDAEESGQLSVTLRNAGWLDLTRATLKVTSSDPNVTFEDGGSTTLPTLPAYSDLTVRLGVSIGAAPKARSVLRLVVTPREPDSLRPSADIPYELLYNIDDLPLASASDDVESAQSAWESEPNVQPAWSRVGDARNHLWHGDDLPASTDESLVSPELFVSTVNPLVLSFSHRYSFEVGQVRTGGPVVAFDGGVIEISDDGGETYHDLSVYADPGYDARLLTVAQSAGALDGGVLDGGVDAGGETLEVDTNVLAGRPAFAGDSAGYPNFVRASIDLGMKLAGKTIKLRFRIGTDEGTGAPGWDIDDIAFGPGSFSGIENEPFSAIVDDGGSCDASAAGT